jgi:hypothetical protein
MLKNKRARFVAMLMAVQFPGFASVAAAAAIRIEGKFKRVVIQSQSPA